MRGSRGGVLVVLFVGNDPGRRMPPRAFPACAINIPTGSAMRFANSVTDASRMIVSNEFTIGYSNCMGFVDNDVPRAQPTETTQLTLNKP